MAMQESRHKFVSGLSTTAGTLVFLAIVVVLQYIILQHPVRWDVTKTGKYTLAPQSKKILDTYRQKQMPIEVLAFYDTKSIAPREAVQDLLEQYRYLYSGFQYSFIDPDRDRALAKANKIDSYPTLVVKAGDRDERISTADEETLTNALAKLLRTDLKKIYFLKGHGELDPDSSEPRGFKEAKDQIEKQNYKTEELVLLRAPGVPDDATMLIVAGCRHDPMDSELESIRNYLSRGGSLLALLDPFRSPNLCALLKDYGFETADDIVVDKMSKALGGDYLMPVITTYVPFPITKNFDVASFFPECRTVTVPQQPGPGLEAQALALTSPVSWTINKEQLDSGKADFDEKTGKKGPLSVMAVATHLDPEAAMKPATADGKRLDGEAQGAERPDSPKQAKKARLVVCGSSQFASNKFFRLQGNGDLFMNAVSWLAEDENLIAIRPKSTHGQPMILSERDSVAMFFVSVVLLPLAWVLVGLFVYVYRRRSVTL
jgi:ABC-type uncharacterized transport system involved in gliding motility auxiliary subunit